MHSQECLPSSIAPLRYLCGRCRCIGSTDSQGDVEFHLFALAQYGQFNGLAYICITCQIGCQVFKVIYRGVINLDDDIPTDLDLVGINGHFFGSTQNTRFFHRAAGCGFNDQSAMLTCIKVHGCCNCIGHGGTCQAEHGMLIGTLGD